jgi:hypothetical protein
MVLEIIEVSPPLPCHLQFVMLESFTCCMVIRYDASIVDPRPQVWTNMINKKNPSGKWHALAMNLVKTESDGKIHHYRANCVLTGQGRFEYTTRVGIKMVDEEDEVEGGLIPEEEIEKDEDDDSDIVLWKWAGGFGNNGKIVVHPPNDKMPWTKGAQAVEVSQNVYVGNYIAASHASDMGFDAVLNMSSELDDFYGPNMQYLKLGLPDGAHNAIDGAVIKEAVQWIDERVRENKKVLVHCRAGIGRSGSIGIAYLYYSNPSWTFKDTLRAIWSVKPEVYPHQNLDASLEKLYSRELISDDSDSSLAPEGSQAYEE